MDISKKIGEYWGSANEPINKFMVKCEDELTTIYKNHEILCNIALAVGALALSIIKIIFSPIAFSVGAALGLTLSFFKPKQMHAIKDAVKEYYNEACGIGKVSLIAGAILLTVFDPGVVPGFTIGAIVSPKLTDYFYPDLGYEEL